MQFLLSEWHVYAFTSNRRAPICSQAIEEKKIVSYTSLLLLLNKIDRIAMVYVRAVNSLLFSSNQSFFLSLSRVRIKRVRQERVEKYTYVSI